MGNVRLYEGVVSLTVSMGNVRLYEGVALLYDTGMLVNIIKTPTRDFYSLRLRRRGKKA